MEKEKVVLEGKDVQKFYNFKKEREKRSNYNLMRRIRKDLIERKALEKGIRVSEQEIKEEIKRRGLELK
jgi:predicted nuclease of restriction endonuclease-like (RecB) superfamily